MAEAWADVYFGTIVGINKSEEKSIRGYKDNIYTHYEYSTNVRLKNWDGEVHPFDFSKQDVKFKVGDKCLMVNATIPGFCFDKTIYLANIDEGRVSHEYISIEEKFDWGRSIWTLPLLLFIGNALGSAPVLKDNFGLVVAVTPVLWLVDLYLNAKKRTNKNRPIVEQFIKDLELKSKKLLDGDYLTIKSEDAISIERVKASVA